jgi:transcription elongation factor GreB
MSRAFVKDDADSERVIVPQRAPLPEGVPNLVTPRGLALLVAERAERIAERDALFTDPDAPDRARRLTVSRERLDDLEERIASARVVRPPVPSGDVAGVGATVTVLVEDGERSRFTIVGVDEADPLEGLVAFTAPLASAVLERRAGDEVRATLGGHLRSVRVEDVRYAATQPGDEVDPD